MMTEDEAKTKWCPFARVGNAAGCNRYPMEHDAYKAQPFAKCIGSACMAWRWLYEAGEIMDGPPQRSNARGWCGLAGHP